MMRLTEHLAMLFTLAALQTPASITAPLYDTFINNPIQNSTYIISQDSQIVLNYNSFTQKLEATTDGTNPGSFRMLTQTANLGGVFTTDFVVGLTTDSDNWYNQINLVALSSSTSALGYGYDAYFRAYDKISIRRAGTEVAATAWNLRADGAFTLALEGSYLADGRLKLTLTVTDQNYNSQTLNYTDSTPLTGQVFGTGCRVNNSKNLTLNTLMIAERTNDPVQPALCEEFIQNPESNPYYEFTVQSQLDFTHDAANDLYIGTTDGTDAGNFSILTPRSDLTGPPKSDFTVSASVNSDNWYNQINLIALAASSSTDGYAAYFRGKDEIAIKRAETTVATAAKTVRADGDFELTLKGRNFSNGDLKLTFVIIDQNGGTQTLTYTDSSPLTGPRFGIGGRIANTKTLTMDRLVIAPTPKHPHLLLSNTRLEQVRQQAFIDPLMGGVLDAIRQDAESFLSSSSLEYKSTNSELLDEARRACKLILAEAFQFRLTGDPRFADAAITDLLEISSFTNWHHTDFLSAAEMSVAASFGYDWLHDELTTTERAVIRDAITANVLQYAPEAYGIGTPGTGNPAWFANTSGSSGPWSSRNNKNQVCNAGYLAAALAMELDQHELATIALRGAVLSLPDSLVSYGPDGAWPEGVTYWNYGLSHSSLGMALLNQAFGSSFGLIDIPGVLETCAFNEQVFGPSGYAFNFADCGESSAAVNRGGMQLAWLAAQAGQTETTLLRDRLWECVETHTTPQRFVFNTVCFPDASSETYQPPALDSHFAGDAEQAFFRSAADDPDALWIGFKGGSNSWSHSHLDLGSFVIESDGVRWGIDLGPDSYSLPGYWDYENGGQRWDYIRCSSLGHNTVALGNVLQDATATAPVTDYQSGTSSSFAIMDLTDAYPGQAQQLRRGVNMLDRARIVVQDEVSGATVGQVMDWRMLTRAAIAISTDGKIATLTQDGKTLKVRILASASSAVFTVAQLPTQPAGAESNIGVQILNIHYTLPQTTERLAVMLRPIGTGWPSLALPTVTPLDNW